MLLSEEKFRDLVSKQGFDHVTVELEIDKSYYSNTNV